MPKGEHKSNKEVKKPKKEKAAVAATGFLGKGSTSPVPAGKKKG